MVYKLTVGTFRGYLIFLIGLGYVASKPTVGQVQFRLVPLEPGQFTYAVIPWDVNGT